MSKQYNIHWRRSDYSKLSHLVRKVNKKVFEIEVKRPDIAGYQPAMLDYKELKNQIKTRADFNRIMNKYNRYLQQGSEEIVTNKHGVSDTVWAKKEFSISQRADNLRKAHKRAEIEAKEVEIAGEKTGVTRAEMGSIRQNELKPSNKNFENMKDKEWKIAKERFDKIMFDKYREERDYLLRDNYIKALHKLNYPDIVERLVLQIPVAIFNEKHETDEVCHIDFLYDPIDMSWKVDIVTNAWTNVLNECRRGVSS